LSRLILAIVIFLTIANADIITEIEYLKHLNRQYYTKLHKSNFANAKITLLNDVIEKKDKNAHHFLNAFAISANQAKENELALFILIIQDTLFDTLEIYKNKTDELRIDSANKIDIFNNKIDAIFNHKKGLLYTIKNSIKLDKHILDNDIKSLITIYQKNNLGLILWMQQWLFLHKIGYDGDYLKLLSLHIDKESNKRGIELFNHLKDRYKNPILYQEIYYLYKIDADIEASNRYKIYSPKLSFYQKIKLNIGSFF